MNSQLSIKVLKTSIDSLPKNIRSCSKANSYSFISGFGKKGSFQIYSFYDELGNLIKRNRLFKKGNTERQEISYYKKEENKNVIKTYFYLKNKVQKFIKKIYDNNSLIEYEIDNKKDFEKHKIAKLRAGEKPKEIEYKTYWDGRAPRIKFTNTENFLKGFKGQHYLPVIINPDSALRFNHMHENQIKSQKIKDIVKNLTVLSRKDAVENFRNIKEIEKDFIVSGFSSPNGEIFIINDRKNILDEAEIIAHENQHLRDFSDICRLDYNAPYAANRFECKSVRKGIITEEQSPKRYRELKKLHKSFINSNYETACIKGEHDDLDIEKPAIKKGLKEAVKLMKIQNIINKFLYE